MIFFVKLFNCLLIYFNLICFVKFFFKNHEINVDKIFLDIYISKQTINLLKVSAMGRKNISHIRKPEILRHTYMIIEEEGFMGMTLTKIANRMGINSGMLIHYFKTKDDLILELVDYLLEITMDSYRSLLEHHTTPSKRLKALMDNLFDPSGSVAGRGKVFWSCYALGLRNKKVEARIQKLSQQLIGFAVSEIELYEKAGLVNVEDKEEAATTVFAIVEGFGYFRNTLGDNPHLAQVAKVMKQNTLDAMGVIGKEVYPE